MPLSSSSEELEWACPVVVRIAESCFFLQFIVGSKWFAAGQRSSADGDQSTTEGNRSGTPYTGGRFVTARSSGEPNIATTRSSAVSGCRKWRNRIGDSNGYETRRETALGACCQEQRSFGSKTFGLCYRKRHRIRALYH
jgi:hypothetical protein